MQTIRVGFVALMLVLAVLAGSGHAAAQQPGARDFNIQVSPATLAITLTPGKQKTATIIVRNLSNHPETLTPRLSGFSTAKNSGKIELDNKPPANMAAWVSFKQPQLVIGAGESKTLDIQYNTPNNVGFSYTSAITLARANDTAQVPATGAGLKGTVAVFNLINIDRPDAKRELTIVHFEAGKGSYEFLPASFTLAIKNNGNVIDQPRGNIFIQRSFNDETPIATIPVNASASYVLPGNTRSITTEWNDGFPAYKPTADGGRHLEWNWKNLNQLRFGKYTAKAVLVYNDGRRDVPVIASVSFWVIPWRIIIVSLIITVVLVMGLFGWGRLIAMGTKKVKRYAVRK